MAVSVSRRYQKHISAMGAPSQMGWMHLYIHAPTYSTQARVLSAALLKIDSTGRPNVRLVMMMRSLRSVPLEGSLETALGAGGVLTVPGGRQR